MEKSQTAARLYFCMLILQPAGGSRNTQSCENVYFRRYSRQNGDGTNPTCTRNLRCIFPGYIEENAIQNNFQRVPPLPDGSVCKFPAIAVETEPSNPTAPFVYQRLCDTQIQKRGNIVLFTHYSQRNAPNRRPYRPKAINVRGKEVHEKLFFIDMVVRKGRTEKRCSQARNVFMYAFPRYRQ